MSHRCRLETGWILQHSADPRIKMSLYVVSSNGPVTVYFGDSSLKSFLVWVVSGVASRLNIKQISSAILHKLLSWGCQFPNPNPTQTHAGSSKAVILKKLPFVFSDMWGGSRNRGASLIITAIVQIYCTNCTNCTNICTLCGPRSSAAQLYTRQTMLPSPGSGGLYHGAIMWEEF